MDKQKTEKEYQQGIELIQSYVTDYLVKNYQGIEKIEWQGIGVEYRNSPILGPSLFGNYVDTDVKIYASENIFFTVEFRLNDEVDYDNDLNKYVQSQRLNNKNTDVSVRTGINNALYAYSDDLNVKKLKVKDISIFDKIQKSSNGSKEATVTYNLEVHELIY